MDDATHRFGYAFENLLITAISGDSALHVLRGDKGMINISAIITNNIDGIILLWALSSGVNAIRKTLIESGMSEQAVNSIMTLAGGTDIMSIIRMDQE